VDYNPLKGMIVLISLLKLSIVPYAAESWGHSWTAFANISMSNCFPIKLIYYVENINSTNFILGTNTKSTNLRIHELVIFNQTTKIDAHEEKYFHSM